MGNGFLFIDGVQADRNAKRQMRRHVMKGKNVGKKFHRPSKLTPTVPKIIDAWSRSKASGQSNNDGTYIPDVDRKFGDALRVFGIPVNIPPPARQIIDDFFFLTADRMYPLKLGISLDEAKFVWLKVLFEDQATYECNLAMMQICNEIYLGRGDNSSTALYCLSRTVSHVKNKLQSPGALSDSTITLVLSLISQEQLKRYDSRAKIHLDGLQRMIELRGGLEKLEEKAPLLLKVCKVDVIFSLQHGGSTLFFRDQMPRVRKGLTARGLLNDIPTLPSIHEHLLNNLLREVLKDVLDVSDLINNSSAKGAVDLITFQEILMSVFYRLLHIHPLHGPPINSNMDAMYHLGLTIFMMTMFITLEKQRILDCRPVSEGLRELLDRDLSKSRAELLLWVLLVGGIWTATVEGDWILPELHKIKTKLHLSDWGQVCTTIKPFPWIGVLHDQPGRSLWTRLDSF